MRNYSNKISLLKNSRGIYCIDTIIGCSSGMNNEVGGCYNDCYAAKSAKTYGYDFSKTVLRYFNSEAHKRKIISQINRVKLDFVRIGCSGDPSENWEHTIEIIKTLSKANKEIVFITRHWTLLTDNQLEYLSTKNVCFNTSVSAMDKPELIQRSTEQYVRIKKYCKSMLRVVSCNFNKENKNGFYLSQVQHDLFKNDNVIDTVFRPSANNKLIVDGIINVKKEVFNGNKQLASKFNKKTFMGKCTSCKEMCGVKMNIDNKYLKKRGIVKQQNIFG